jgi:hypothetical protein
MPHQWRTLSSSVTEEYDHAGQVNATPTPHKRLPWNKGTDRGKAAAAT